MRDAEIFKTASPPRAQGAISPGQISCPFQIEAQIVRPQAGQAELGREDSNLRMAESKFVRAICSNSTFFPTGAKSGSFSSIGYGHFPDQSGD
jgi:hypothetical protein